LNTSISALRSGNEDSTVSPRVDVASRPGAPVRVRMGMLVRRVDNGVNSCGRPTGGWLRGRKPRGKETVKGEWEAVEVGMEDRIGKVGGVDILVVWGACPDVRGRGPKCLEAGSGRSERGEAVI